MGTANVAHLNRIVPMWVATISLVGYHDRRQLRGEISWLELKLMAAAVVTTCAIHDEGKCGFMTIGTDRSLETLRGIRMTR